MCRSCLCFESPSNCKPVINTKYFVELLNIIVGSAVIKYIYTGSKQLLKTLTTCYSMLLNGLVMFFQKVITFLNTEGHFINIFGHIIKLSANIPT